MFCKNCGTEINGTAKFCLGCGAKVEQKQDSDVCPECGAPVKADAKFCEGCGAALGGGRPEVLSPMPPTANDDNHPVCPYCGMKLNSTDDSCPYCGKKAVLRRSMSAQQQPAPAPQPVPAPAPQPVPSSAPAQGTAAAASSYCRACGAALKADIKFCTACGAAVNRPSAPALEPLPLPKRMPAGGAAPVVTATVTSATITDGAPVATPMRKPEVGSQKTPRKASDRLKQQAGTAARQAVKTALQKIMEIETPASGMPGETRTTLNSEQMSVLSTVARSLFKR